MWNKCNVVMLPTKEKTDILLTHNGLFCTKHVPMFLTLDKNYKHQHLYITSDEEIKEGDWFICNQAAQQCIEVREGNNYPYKIINKCNGEEQYHSKHWKGKIIATTDTSLKLPLIPQQFINAFIEQYNKGNIIKEVLVEYQTDWSPETIMCMEGYGNNPDCFPYEPCIKVNSFNEISIINQKDSWNREEVIEFVYKVLKATGKEIKAEMVDIRTCPHIIFTGVDEWIEENL